MSRGTTKTANSSKGSSYSKQIDEHQWECKACSAKNLTSEKRCQSCAKPRVNRQSFAVGSSHIPSVEEQFGQSPLSRPFEATDDIASAKSSEKGKYLCHIVSVLKDRQYFESSWRPIEQNLNISGIVH